MEVLTPKFLNPITHKTYTKLQWGVVGFQQTLQYCLGTFPEIYHFDLVSVPGEYRICIDMVNAPA